MAVLVTGASGFLGGRLVEMLAARGDEIIVLARPSSSLNHLAGLTAGTAAPVRVVRTELSPQSPAEPALHQPGIPMRAGLAGSPTPRNEAPAVRPFDPAWREALRQVTHLYHCAGCSTDWASDRGYQAGNVAATEAMLAAASVAAPRLERFVHVSTTDVYGYPRAPGDEQAPLHDTGLGYNHSKILGERAVWRAAADGLPVTILRPATIYGPRGTAFVTDIAKLLRERTMAYVDGGRQPGGFVYVDDVAQAMIEAAHSQRTQGEAYNLSSLAGESWKHYCSLLASALGLPAPWINLPFSLAMGAAHAMEAPHRYLRVPGRPLLTRHAVYLLGRDQQFSSAKAQAAFGYAPRVSLEQGVGRSAAWLQGRGAAGG